MRKFDKLSALAVPLDEQNIDIDQLIPARFLLKLRAEGYQQFLFHDRRFNTAGGEKADFILNQPPFRQAKIIVSDSNFGSGSAREHAVYALMDYGIRAVIVPSFGSIFLVNCLKNGLLPLQISSALAAGLRGQLRATPGSEIAIDLEQQKLTGPDGAHHHFDINPAHRHRLLEGLDDIDLTLAHSEDIAAFEKRHQAAHSWLFENPARQSPYFSSSAATFSRSNNSLNSSNGSMRSP